MDAVEVDAAEVEAAVGSPAAPVGDPGPVLARLRQVVRIEVIGIALVLALTAVLANTTPARSVEGGGVVSVRAKLGDGTVEVLVDPARTGRNDIHAYLLTADGGVDGRYDAATFQLALPAEDIGPLERTPVVAAPGHFQLVGTDLAPAGEWQLTITVKPDRFTEESATVTFRVR